MNRNLWAVGVAAAVVAVAAACAPPEGVTTGKAEGGVTTYLTEWRNIKPWELAINIADLDGMAGTKYGTVEMQTRDNDLIHQRAYFYRGRLNIQHSLSGFYGGDSLNNETKSREAVREYYEGRKVEFVDSARIRDPGERGGWAHLVGDPKAEGRTCIFGEVGFLTPAKRGDLDAAELSEEAYDVIVYLRDCSGKRSFARVVDFLTGMKVVEPEYNRMLMAGG